MSQSEEKTIMQKFRKSLGTTIFTTTLSVNIIVLASSLFYLDPGDQISPVVSIVSISISMVLSFLAFAFAENNPYMAALSLLGTGFVIAIVGFSIIHPFNEQGFANMPALIVNDFYSNLAVELFSIAITVFVIDRIYSRLDKRKDKGLLEKIETLTATLNEMQQSIADITENQENLKTMIAQHDNNHRSGEALSFWSYIKSTIQNIIFRQT